VIAHIIGERKQNTAKMIVAETAKRLTSVPPYVTDGLKFYIQALLEQYGKWIWFESSGLRGRPRSPRLVPDDNLDMLKSLRSGKRAS
jgi:hypothetical protein